MSFRHRTKNRTLMTITGCRTDAPPECAHSENLVAKDGTVLVTDGPYAETKEQLGGVAIN